MKKLLIILSILALISTSCKSKETSTKPENLIPQDSLTFIVAESYLIEAQIHEGIRNYQEQCNATRMLYDELFKKHNITQEGFEQSVQYYLSDKELAEPFLRECDSILATMKEDFIGPADSTSLPQ